MADFCPANQFITNSVLEPQAGWLYQWVPRWTPSSPEKLRDAEESLISFVPKSLESEGFYVNCGTIDGETTHIWTRRFQLRNKKYDEDEIPLVMIHGMGAGLAMFALNFAALAQFSTVYAIDLPGFARSSRPSFSSDPEVTESQYVASIEAWRKHMGLEKINILGHSFGGYLTMSYSLSHPDRLNKVILADPWGLSSRPQDVLQSTSFPWWAKALFRVIIKFNPLAILRASGPMGPRLLKRARPDLALKFLPLVGEENLERIGDYLYHCNAHSPGGETAFHRLSDMLAWAANPMLPRLQGNLSRKLPITFLFGDNSWVYNRVKDYDQVIASIGEVVMIEEAGHHIYADQSQQFNHAVLDFLQKDL